MTFQKTSSLRSITSAPMSMRFATSAPSGQPVDEMPFDPFMGKAVCFDLRNVPDLGDITAPHMDEAEKEAGFKAHGRIGLLCIGFHRRTYPTIDSVLKNSQLTVEATQRLYHLGSRMTASRVP